MGMLKQELKETLNELKPPSIAIIGRTGAGKSTLINAVFGKELAPAGAGLPVSHNFERYPQSIDERSPVTIYDSRGYEAGEDKFIQGVSSFLDQKYDEGIENQIHLIWYIIPASTKRFLPFDAEIIGTLRNKNVPIVIVIAQADIARSTEIAAMEAAIEGYKSDHGLTDIERVLVAAEPMREDEKPFGVSELVNKTTVLLPKLYIDAFVARQIVNLEVKRKAAINHIKLAAGSSLTAGFIPIPFTTPAATISSQRFLLNKIASLYGYTELAEILDKVGGSVSVASMVTHLGTSILDFISAVTIEFGGAIVAGAAAGAAAATFISVVGLTYISVFEKLSKEDLSGAGREEIEKISARILKEEFKKYSSTVRIINSQDLNNLEELYSV